MVGVGYDLIAIYVSC